MNGWVLKDYLWVAKQNSQLLFPPLVTGRISTFSPDVYLDVMHVRSSLGKEYCIWDSSCKLLPAALVSADATSLNTTPYPNRCCQHLPAKADVVPAAQAPISGPHRCPPTPRAPSLCQLNRTAFWGSQDTCPVIHSEPFAGSPAEASRERSGELEGAWSLIILPPWSLVQMPQATRMLESFFFGIQF